MKNKYWIILACLVVVAIIIVISKGFNVGLKYSENDLISVEIEKEFEIADIKKITDEVFGKKRVLIQKVELYKDIVQITVDSVTDEQLQSLNEKINEKYELSNETENISVVHNSNTKLSQISKKYIIPLIVASLVILVYEVIKFNKLGIFNVVKHNLLIIIIPQIVLASIYAICRVPVNYYAVIASLCIYIISEYKGIKKLQTQKEKVKSKK